MTLVICCYIIRYHMCSSMSSGCQRGRRIPQETNKKFVTGYNQDAYSVPLWLAAVIYFSAWWIRSSQNITRCNRTATLTLWSSEALTIQNFTQRESTFESTSECKSPPQISNYNTAKHRCKAPCHYPLQSTSNWET